jgi:hypothetical protein
LSSINFEPDSTPLNSIQCICGIIIFFSFFIFLVKTNDNLGSWPSLTKYASYINYNNCEKGIFGVKPTSKLRFVNFQKYFKKIFIKLKQLAILIWSISHDFWSNYRFWHKYTFFLLNSGYVKSRDKMPCVFWTP